MIKIKGDHLIVLWSLHLIFFSYLGCKYWIRSNPTQGEPGRIFRNALRVTACGKSHRNQGEEAKNRKEERSSTPGHMNKTCEPEATIHTIRMRCFIVSDRSLHLIMMLWIKIQWRLVPKRIFFLGVDLVLYCWLSSGWKKVTIGNFSK